jgi:hypothetical protein
MPEKMKRPYIPVPDEELKEIKHEAIEEGEKSGHYMLKLMRFGRFAKILLGKYLFGSYDLSDTFAIYRGEKPVREEIEEEIEELERKLPPREFYERLLNMKRFCREGKRIIEIREDVLDEKIDELEHMLEG